MTDQHEHGDAGFSLIELTIYVMLALIALTATMMVLIISWTTQRDVESVNTATNRGQTMGAVIERAMRNSLEFEVSPDGSQLRVRTSLEGPLQCQGFLLTDGMARFAQSASTLPASSTWSAWQPGIRRAGSSLYFTQTGHSVTYSFDITTESAPVRVIGEAAARSAATGVSSPCW